jgi:penicillin-binding protein 1A
MVRQAMYERYKDAAYTEGYKVYTTLDSHHQQWAYDALRAGLIDFDRKQGYRAPESYIDLASAEGEDQTEVLDDALSEIRDSGDMQAAIVLSASLSKCVPTCAAARWRSSRGRSGVCPPCAEPQAGSG